MHSNCCCKAFQWTSLMKLSSTETARKTHNASIRILSMFNDVKTLKWIQCNELTSIIPFRFVLISCASHLWVCVVYFGLKRRLMTYYIQIIEQPKMSIAYVHSEEWTLSWPINGGNVAKQQSSWNVKQTNFPTQMCTRTMFISQNENRTTCIAYN